MIKGGIGGGNTQTGLVFENQCDLAAALALTPGITVAGNAIFVDGKKVALLFPKYRLYDGLLMPRGVNYKDYLSKRLEPDESILSLETNVLTVVEKKFQQGSGSADEKLQTCDFKNKQYAKLLKPLNIAVRYTYVLSEWFEKPEYKDVLNYITSVGCFYFFREIPLDFIGILEQVKP